MGRRKTSTSRDKGISSHTGIIIVAIIGLIGTIVTAIFSLLSSTKPLELAIYTTQTAEAKLTGIADFSILTQSSIPPSATWTSSPTDTQTPTFTATTVAVVPNVLLQDEFIDNRNGWLLQDEQLIRSNIIGGKYKHTITCPQEYDSFYCGNYFIVPNLSSKDLEFELDASIIDISPNDAEVMIAFQFRKNASDYYDVYYRSIGQYTINIVHNGSLDKLLAHTTIPSFSLNTNSVNRYGFSAVNTIITPLYNGQELLAIEDGNINQAGSVYVAIFVQRGSSAIVELDNLRVIDRSPQ